MQTSCEQGMVPALESWLPREGSRKETTKSLQTTSVQIVKRSIKEIKLELLPAKVT